jgi:hypothetical protein
MVIHLISPAEKQLELAADPVTECPERGFSPVEDEPSALQRAARRMLQVRQASIREGLAAGLRGLPQLTGGSGRFGKIRGQLRIWQGLDRGQTEAGYCFEP